MIRYWRSLVFIFILMFAATAVTAQTQRAGTRYLIIDQDVQSVTTRFADAEVTATRLAGGKIETRLKTSSGRTIGLTFPEQEGVPLDAVTAERYAAWKGRRSAAPDAAALIDGIESVTSVTRDLEAFSRRGAAAGVYQGKEIPSFTSALRDRKTQELIAVMAWYAGRQELVFHARWQPAALAVSQANLPNGWPVLPDMAWANIQMLSFVRSHEDVARRRGERTGGRFALAPHDDPGCTGLHWLDGGVLRPCCDEHDRCYEWFGCTYRSWWFQGSWSCVQCNVEVVVCFWTRWRLCDELDWCPIIGWRWDSGGQVYDCYLSGPGYCPAWCRACTY